MAGITGSESDDNKTGTVEKVEKRYGDQNGGMTREKSSSENESEQLSPIKTDVIMNGNGESSSEDSGLSSPVSVKNEEEGKGDSKEGEKEEDGKNEQEIVLIQDTGFTVQLAVPGMDNIELPVSSMELVQEIHQVLMDREDTCHRTCFTLQLEGITMDNFAELKSIEGLKEGSVIKVVEEPYTVREARIHVRHIRDLLKSVDPADSYNGVDCSSLSFLNTVTAGDILDKKRSKPDSLDCTPPDYIMPNSKDRPLIPLHPGLKDMKGPQCIKVLTYSGWNPPPGNRKMHGDLLYLYVVTLEDKRYHITASTQGFYVNQSTEEEFNPKAAQQKYLSHSLIDLLSQISPAFKKNFTALLKRRGQKHPFERVPTPYQVFSWMAPQPDHSIDYIRAEDAFSTRLGYEEHIPGQTRDWNEEIQTTRELPRKTLPERLIRERAIFKVHSDFVGAATRGAMAVIDGNVMAINPGEEAKMQMFIWNNIFFSLGFDVKDHYKDFGGDSAAYAAPGNDLQGVKAYFGTDVEGLYTLGTVVVDYRGYRVTAQSIIPGILEREQEQSVVYGSIDFGKTIVFNEKYKELLTKTAQQLKVRAHKVLNDKGDEVELYSSLECKGIVGNDQRHYILDLLRTYPPDVNYLDVSEEEFSKSMREHGYPKKHRHKLACLRSELIEAFVEAKYIAFVRHAAYQIQQIRMDKENKLSKVDSGVLVNGEGEGHEKKSIEDKKLDDKEDDKDNIDEAKKMVEELSSTETENEENSKEVVRRAAKAVGSLSDTEFNITFNPDVFQSHVKHANADSEDLRREKQLVKDAAEFLVVHQIPSFIKDSMEHTSSPIDTLTITEQLHQKGINMRYLGKVAEVLKKYPSVQYVYTIVITELVCRSTKHIFKAYMQGVDMMNLSAAISHFLNCLLGSFPSPHAPVTAEELHGKKARRKNSKRNKTVLLGMDNTDWVTETPKTLWKKIVEEVQEYYHYEIHCDSVDTFTEKYGVQRVSLLRAFCHKVGIQILLREYNLDVRNKQIFYEEDIINIFPVVKHVQPRASDACHFFTSGQTKIQQCLLREGHDLISEALNLLNNVYGAMHPDIASCLRLLARLNYMLGDYSEAMSYQQRAVLMSERVLGIDHPNTITEYAHLAMYCFANSQVSSALRLLYRARYLAILCHSEDHPEVAIIDSNIGLILHAVEEFDLSLRFLEHALELNCKYFGAKTLKGAMNYHLVAWTHSCRGDFRAALQSEKEAYTIYKQLLGEDHEKTKESSNNLKRLTQNAVNFQKKMNEIYKGEKNFRFPPLEIQRPSIGSVLEMLNLVNGIVFVHISPEEIEKLRQVNSRYGVSKSESDSESKVKEIKENNLPNGHSTENGDLDIEVNTSDLDLRNNTEVTVADGM